MAEENNENKSWKDRLVEAELERIKTLDIKLKMKKEQDRYEVSERFKNGLRSLGVYVGPLFPGTLEYEDCGVKFVYSYAPLTGSHNIKIVQECPKCGVKMLSVPITSVAVLASNLVKFKPECPHNCIKPVSSQPETQNFSKQICEYEPFVSIGVDNLGVVYCLNKYGSVLWYDHTKKMWIKMPVDVEHQ